MRVIKQLGLQVIAGLCGQRPWRQSQLGSMGLEHTEHLFMLAISV